MKQLFTFLPILTRTGNLAIAFIYIELDNIFISTINKLQNSKICYKWINIPWHAGFQINEDHW